MQENLHVLQQNPPNQVLYPLNKNVYTFSNLPAKNLEHFSLRMCKATFSSFPVPVVFLLPAERPLHALLHPWSPVGNSWIIRRS